MRFARIFVYSFDFVEVQILPLTLTKCKPTLKRLVGVRLFGPMQPRTFVRLSVQIIILFN